MTNKVDTDKRRFLTNATTVVGSIGAIAVTIPFISSLSPSAKARAAGAPVEVDISKLEIGQLLTIEWRGKPVFVFRRSEETLSTLANLKSELRDPHSEELGQQPDYCKNDLRSIRQDLMVLVGICTHLGCAPTYRPELAPEDLGPDWQGGFFCPCHGSTFDLAGRVYQSVPAPTNLVVPPHYFINDNKLLIGKEKMEAA
jgi:ubiquinol-cytochrome c reductase iron-sulfur subunit|tara:strand:- start:2951 stop:3547 length:597 start_codon:yes stop_codon:yes gene_type:complete